METIEELKKKKMSEFMEAKKMTKIDVTDSSFEKEVIEKSKEVPVVVDFWAEWCGPCRMLGPTIEKLASEYEGKFVLAKFDVQENPQKATEYAVMSIPSVKLFKDGKIVADFMGALPEDVIKDWLNKNL